MGNLGIAASARRLVAYRDLVVSRNPLSYYRLGESSATAAIDVMGRANGTYGGPNTYGVQGLVHDMNTAVTFTGSGFVDISDTGLPTAAAARTLEAWINTTDGSHSAAAIVGYGVQAANQDFEMRNIFGALGLVVRPNIYTLGGTVNAGTPTQCIVTFDGTNARGFVNGALVGSPTAVTPATVLAGATGLEIAVWSNFFTGTIDEVAIYAYALSAAQIADSYHTAGY